MKKTLLKNANILNGHLNMEVQENMDILIEGEKISKIGKDLVEPKAKTVDLKGAYVMPGLINMHVHLPAGGKLSKKKVADQKKLVKLIQSNNLMRSIGINLCGNYAKLELYSGVTTLRSVGGIADFDTILRDKIAAGKKVGPRILASNTAIGVPGGHMDETVAKGANSVEEAVKLVEEVAKQKADLIKIMITGGVLDCKEKGHPGVLKMSAEMVKACCDKAHELGLKVAAHDEGPEGVEIAILNGVDTIEHGASVDAKLVKEYKKRKGAFICTLSPAVPLATLDVGYGDDAKFNTEVLLNGMVDFTKNCLKNGVPVGLGTDTGCPLVTHYDMYRELIYFTKYIEGVDNNFAIHTATEVNAQIAGIADFTGTVDEGKFADLLVSKNNPLENLIALKEPLMVFAKGKKYSKKIKRYENVEELLNSIL